MTRALLYFTLLAVAALPSAMSYLAGASSHAAGGCIAAVIVLALHARHAIANPAATRRAFFIAAIVVALLLAHLGIAAFWQPIRWTRAIASLAPLTLWLLAGHALSVEFRHADNEDLRHAVFAMTVTLLAIGFWGKFGVQPWAGVTLSKPVFPFTEPSHFALVFAPYMLFAGVMLRGWKRLALLVLCAALSLLLKNVTLSVACVLLVAVCVPPRWIVPVAIAAAVVLSRMDLTFYIERLDFTTQGRYWTSAQLSTLVYMQGWQLMAQEFINAHGWGIGFQQFGLHGTRTAASYAIRTIMGYPLNLMDGGFTMAKLVGELGLFGVGLVVAYCVAGARCMRSLRVWALRKQAWPCNTRIFAACIIVGASLEIFFRGAGYFTGSSLLLAYSLFEISRTDNYSGNQNVR